MAHSSMAGMFLTYRPPVQKGEAILGYLYRALYTGGHVRMKDLATTLVDRQTIQPPWTVSSNLRRLRDELDPVFRSAEEILAKHTCLPAHLPFVTKQLRAPLMAHVLDGEKHPGIAAAVGLTGKAIESKPRMAMCPRCVLQDTLQHGFAYWHREHALAGISYCPHHGKPLEVGCGACRFSQIGSRQPLMPGLECWCGGRRALSQPWVTAAEGAVLTRMAAYGLQLLDGALDGCAPDEVGAYYRLCAHRAGYADATRVKSPSLAADLRRRYTPAVLARLNATLEAGCNWIQKSMGAGVAPNILGRNLLLFDFFGRRIPDATDLKQADEHVWGLLEKRRARAQRVRSDATADEIQADRVAILQYLDEHKGASRTHLLKALGRTVMRARARDAEWYDALVPVRKDGRKPNSKEECAGYWADFDERTAVFVFTRRQELVAFPGGYPKAITKAVLLKGTPRANEVTWELLTKLPKTKETIKASVELTIEFKRRYALAILQQPAQEGVDRVMDAHKRTGLPLSEIDRLNFTIVARTE